MFITADEIIYQSSPTVLRLARQQVDIAWFRHDSDERSAAKLMSN